MARIKTLWKGPEEDGVTQSMLCSFLSCRERFRLRVVEGLQPEPEFDHYTEYGHMWHLCDEHRNGDWQGELVRYAQDLATRFRPQQEQISKWYNVCKVQYEVYLEYQAAHKNRTKTKQLLPEYVFSVPYTIPDGRQVLLRGKWDGLNLEGSGKGQLTLQENKTKGEINEEQLRRQLLFDIQTMFYVTALDVALDRHKLEGLEKYKRVSRVRYNVIRRPLSGGKDSIRPLKATKNKPAETMKEYYARLGDRIRDHPEYYFMDWLVTLTAGDIGKFCGRFLNPVLTQLCDWWDYISTAKNPFDGNDLHWQHPYGVYNPMDKGRTSALDEYLATGSKVGLTKATSLFRELE